MTTLILIGNLTSFSSWARWVLLAIWASTILVPFARGRPISIKLLLIAGIVAALPFAMPAFTENADSVAVLMAAAVASVWVLLERSYGSKTTIGVVTLLLIWAPFLLYLAGLSDIFYTYDVMRESLAHSGAHVGDVARYQFLCSDPNKAAFFILIMLIFINTAPPSIDRRSMLLSWSNLGLILSLVCTFSVSGLISGLVLCGYLALARFGRAALSIAGLLCLVVASSAVIISDPANWEELLKRVVGRTYITEHTRFTLMSHALSSWVNADIPRMLIGGGTAALRDWYPPIPSIYPHNTFLSVLLSAGLVGFAALALLLASAVRNVRSPNAMLSIVTTVAFLADDYLGVVFAWIVVYTIALSGATSGCRRASRGYPSQ